MTAKRKRACRYGRNGYFGICGCDDCTATVISDRHRVDWLRRNAAAIVDLIDGEIRVERERVMRKAVVR